MAVSMAVSEVNFGNVSKGLSHSYGTIFHCLADAIPLDFVLRDQ